MNAKHALLPLLVLLPLTACGAESSSANAATVEPGITGLELDGPVYTRFYVHGPDGAHVLDWVPMNEPVAVAPGHYRLVSGPDERMVYAEVDVLEGSLTKAQIGGIGLDCPAGTEVHSAFGVFHPGDDANVVQGLTGSLGEDVAVPPGIYALVRGDTNHYLWYSLGSPVVPGVTTHVPEGGFHNTGDAVELWDSTRTLPMVYAGAGDSYCLPAGTYQYQRGTTWQTLEVVNGTITDG